MDKMENNRSGGIGFGGALMLLFIGLKLGGVIDWHWFWILSPWLIPIIVVGLILLGYAIFMFLIFVYEFIQQKKRDNEYKKWKRNNNYF